MDWNKRKIKNILFVPDFGLNELRKAAEEDIEESGYNSLFQIYFMNSKNFLTITTFKSMKHVFS